MNLDHLTGKKFAILAVSENDNGETESAVFTGIARWDNGRLLLNRNEHKSFQLSCYNLTQKNVN